MPLFRHGARKHAVSQVLPILRPLIASLASQPRFGHNQRSARASTLPLLDEAWVLARSPHGDGYDPHSA